MYRIANQSIERKQDSVSYYSFHGFLFVKAKLWKSIHLQKHWKMRIKILFVTFKMKDKIYTAVITEKKSLGRQWRKVASLISDVLQVESLSHRFLMQKMFTNSLYIGVSTSVISRNVESFSSNVKPSRLDAERNALSLSFRKCNKSRSIFTGPKPSSYRSWLLALSDFSVYLTFIDNPSPMIAQETSTINRFVHYFRTYHCNARQLSWLLDCV